MRETFPTRLLLQLLQATPEKLAAIERFLGGQPLPEPQPSPPPVPVPDAANLSLAAKVFQLLTALDPGNRLRKAPPIKVFNLYYRQRLGPAEIARKCNCDRSLIYDRLATIQEKVPWTPEQLQDVAPHVEAMEEALTDSRAEGIYRKGAAYGDEDGNQGDD